MGKIFLLDPGHGRDTKGKRSDKWEDGSQLFEWEFTRAIVDRIVRWAPIFGLECTNLVPEDEDVSLTERVRRANLYGGRGVVYVSIHANAGGGRGIEVFTSPGQTASDTIATVFINKLMSIYPAMHKRADMSDGDPDKEARFYVLTKTAMPAILTENLFMDNERECKQILMTDSGRDRIALAHIAAMVEVNRGV